MRLTVLFPLACAIAAFILSMLCLFAGSKPNFMENYSIVSLNTSMLGHNIVDNNFGDSASATTSATATASSTFSTPKPTSFSSWISGEFKNATSTIQDGIQSVEDGIQSIEDKIIEEFNDIANDLADKLSAELGIQQWYSLHIMDMCYGNFTPNATAEGASKNKSMECTTPRALYHFDLTQSLNDSLQDSKLGRYINLNLTTLSWPEDLTDGITALNGLASSMFIFYCIGIAFSGIAILTSLVAFFLTGSKIFAFLNWGIFILGFLTLAVASAIVTAVMIKMSNLINEHGNDIGIFAYKGGNFLAITWAAVGLMFVGSVAWIVEFMLGRRREKRVYTEKMTGSRGWKGRF